MSPGAPIDDGVFRLLFVCTANQCRSPMAEVLTAELLERRGVDAEVVSCGVMEGGIRASAGAIRAMARRGLDLSRHMSHQMDSDTVGVADLIITMERRHISSVAELDVPAVRRTFTLVELADLAVIVGPRRVGRAISSWVAEADAMRLPDAVMAASSDSDVPDPMGGSSRAYRRAADQIASLSEVVIGSLFPSG